MKKLVSIFAIVLAFTMLMSVASFAAEPVFKAVEQVTNEDGTDPIVYGSYTTTDDGAEVFKTADGKTTLTSDEDSINVTTTETTAGNYYGVLLVEGNDLPTKDTEILYINQATAAGDTQAFEVLPILPANKDVTLFISSNVAGAGLITIPMTYAEEVVAPTNDYITTADTAKGTIAVDVTGGLTHASMGDAKDNALVSLALDTTAYPNAGQATAGYIIKAVNADGSDIEGATVFYSKERAKYVALVPSTVADYKFEVIANDAEDATANDEIVKYGDVNEDKNNAINASDFLALKKIVKSISVAEAKEALLSDVTADGKVNASDVLQIKKAIKKLDYTFKVLEK